MKNKDNNLLEQVYEGICIKENFEQILHTLKFVKTTKKPLKYSYVKCEDSDMPPLSYKVNSDERTIETVTSDGKETKKLAKVGDIVISGPSKEKYVIDQQKFPKNYQGAIGETIMPEQAPRMAARAEIHSPIIFKATWGEDMILKPGDYLIKDGDSGYYRIAKKEFDLTYNPV